MYRLNCVLSDELGERIHARSEKTGVTKVSLVATAITSYCDQMDLMDRLTEQLTSDPVKLAEVAKALGIVPPKAD